MKKMTLVRLSGLCLIASGLISCMGVGNMSTEMTAASAEQVTSTKNMTPHGKSQVYSSGIASISSAFLTSVASGAGKFVAVGGDGAVFQSTGGTSWAPVSSNINTHLTAVTYAGNMFVAVGLGGQIFKSTAGDVWSSVNNSDSRNLRGIAYGNNTFVAVGENGTLISYTGSDFTNEWAARQLPAGIDPNTTFYAVTFAAATNSFIAVGTNGVLLESTDGINWNIDNSGTQETLLAVAGSAGAIVAVGANGVIVKCDIIPDAGLGCSASSGNVGANLTGVSYGNGKFVAVGEMAGITLISTNGTIWDQQKNDANSNLYGITTMSGVFVVVGEHVAQVQSSVLLPGGDWVKSCDVNTVQYNAQTHVLSSTCKVSGRICTAYTTRKGMGEQMCTAWQAYQDKAMTVSGFADLSKSLSCTVTTTNPRDDDSYHSLSCH